MWELEHKEGWAPRNWCFWTVVVEKTLQSPLDSKEIKKSILKEIKPWIFIGRTGAEAEAPVFWPHDTKNWLSGKHPDAEKDWGQKEKRLAEDEMVGWLCKLNGHELEQTLGESEGQGGPVCCSSWGYKELDRLSYWTAIDTTDNNSRIYILLKYTWKVLQDGQYGGWKMILVSLNDIKSIEIIQSVLSNSNGMK